MVCSTGDMKYSLGTPVVPFSPFHFGVSLFKLSIRKKGTLIVKQLLGNLVFTDYKGQVIVIIQACTLNPKPSTSSHQYSGLYPKP